MTRTIRLSNSYLFNSDPTCRQIGDRFWLFTSHDQASPAFVSQDDSWQNMFDYHAWSTTNLMHWEHHGSIISAFDIPWAKGCTLWDGDAGIPAPDGAYLAYIPVQNTIDHTWEIGVFESSSPGGRYQDILGHPLVTNRTLEHAGFSDFRQSVCLSPTILYDDSHQPFLLFGQFRVFAVPLAPSLRELAGHPFEIAIPARAGNATEYIEGPMIHKIGSNWVFTYMTYKDWDAPNPNFTPDDPVGPYLQYCTADSVWGPYEHPRHWVYPVNATACNNQQGIATFNGQWVVCYHVPWNGTEHRHVVVRTFDPVFQISGDSVGNSSDFANDDNCSASGGSDINGKNTISNFVKTILRPIYPARDLDDPQTIDAIVTLVPSEAVRWAHDACSWINASVMEGPETAHHMRLDTNGALIFPRFLLGGFAIIIELAVQNTNTTPTEISFSIISDCTEIACSDDPCNRQHCGQNNHHLSQEPTLLATIQIPAASAHATTLSSAGYPGHPYWTIYRVETSIISSALLGNLCIAATEPVSIVWFRILNELTKPTDA